MDSADGNRHISYTQNQFSITVYPNNVTLQACHWTGSYTNELTTGVMFKRMKQKTDARSVKFGNLHKGLHHGVRNSGHAARSIIARQVQFRQAFFEVGLDSLYFTLNKYESADRRAQMLAHFVVITNIIARLMHKRRKEIVRFQLLYDVLEARIVRKEVTPISIKGRS